MVLVWKRKKSIYFWTRSRPTRTFGESNDQVRDKSESKYQQVQDKSETIEKRLESGLEYYSPTWDALDQLIRHQVLVSAHIQQLRTVIEEGVTPFSDDTVARRIVDMSDDIERQLVEWIKASPYFAIQLDESTDISNVLLLVFVRHCMDSNLCEDLLFCKELPSRTTADNVMHCLDEYFTEKGLDWKYCTGICTDGTADMTGKHCTVVKQIQERAPEAKCTHCFLHRESLATKQMSPEMHDVMNIAVKTVNYIKKNALNSRCFAALSERLDVDHLQL